MVPGGPPVSQERWAELAREWFPELADTRLRQVTWSAIEVHRDYIVAQLAAGVTMATIYQRLRDERGLAASVASLRRYVAANLPEEARRSQVTVLRLVPAEPGKEAQIDYQLSTSGRVLEPCRSLRPSDTPSAMARTGLMTHPEAIPASRSPTPASAPIDTGMKVKAAPAPITKNGPARSAQ